MMAKNMDSKSAKAINSYMTWFESNQEKNKFMVEVAAEIFLKHEFVLCSDFLQTSEETTWDIMMYQMARDAVLKIFVSMEVRYYRYERPPTTKEEFFKCFSERAEKPLPNVVKKFSELTTTETANRGKKYLKKGVKKYQKFLKGL